MRIGTRGSRLARWQADAVAAALAAAGHGPCEIVVIRTTGDERAFDQLRLVPSGVEGRPAGNDGPASASIADEGKRVFVKEIEEALLAGQVDLAVHSAKDMPVDLADGLTIGAVLPREDPRDAIVLPAGNRQKALGIESNDPAECLTPGAYCLPASGRIGTSSIRRVAQLRAHAPNARFEGVRGNVDTRLRRLDAREYDALVLAAAGLKRLGFGDRISSLVPIEHCVPAPGQGIIAIEIRSDDERARKALRALDHRETAAALAAERAVVNTVGGGCRLPLGAIAIPADGGLEIHAVVVSPDGGRVVRRSARGPAADAEAIGRRVGSALRAAGADRILDEARAQE
jgi:hydroxymethylbilane synthase